MLRRLIPGVRDAMQGCSPQEADTVKEAVATLKRLCRQRTVLSWKEWREAVEKDRRQPSLQVQCPLTAGTLGMSVKPPCRAASQLVIAQPVHSRVHVSVHNAAPTGSRSALV